MKEYRIEINPLGFGRNIEEYIFWEDNASDREKLIEIERGFLKIKQELIEGLKIETRQKFLSEAIEEYDNPRLTKIKGVL